MDLISVIGYDPGGDKCHGVASLQMSNGRVHRAVSATLKTAEEVLAFVATQPTPTAIGIDTLLCWSTGSAGWRPADRWLREQYRAVKNSVASPNSLFGSMGLNGPAVLLSLRENHPHLLATETHPKVLHYHWRREAYDYANQRQEMDKYLSSLVGTAVNTDTEHAWDAMLSALVAYYGHTNQWGTDLHALQSAPDERLVMPCGRVHYFWPNA